MSEHKGKITISRVRSNRDDGYVCIRVEDAVSGCRAIEINLSVLDFAEAILGHGYMACDFILNTSGVIGKKRELREIVIKRPPDRSRRREDSDAGKEWIRQQAPHELVDGWEPHSGSDAFNHHHWTDGGKVRVTLIRFVDAGTKAGDA